MGKLKRGFNWKARLSSDKNFEQVNSPVKDTVQVDIDVREEKYDSSNALVLPSKREKSKLIKKKFKPEEKILSKKQRKHLEKIVEKKKRKIDRSELLEKLQMVQATSEELELMTATHFMQTIGQKRFSSVNKSQDVPLKVSNLKGAKRKKLSASAENSKRHNIDAWQSNDFSTSSAEEDNADDSPEPSFEVSNTESSRNYSEIVPEKLSDEQNAIVTRNEEKAPISSGSKSLTSLKVVEKLHSEPAVFVPVFRTPEIQASREALPIYTEEQYIMEAIRENAVVIIHGATGTGKTTQVPQFLYEAGFTRNKKMIGITEPRRIAAVTMASRVSEEMNLSDAVSYHIRYEKTSTDDKTEIKFMTDGVLLKEIRHDFLLSKYSAIIVDEAHERSVFSDVLIGLLSRILLLRDKKGDPLKVIIMSATIRVEDFTENPKLFKQRPCLLQIKSRQYDVVLHFSTHTPTDYVEAAYKKVCKIHCQLPTGTILVFLTGENEVTKLCKLLRKTFPFLQQDKLPSANKAEEAVFKSPEKRKKMKKSNNESFSDLAPIIDLDNYSVLPLDVEGLQHQISDDDEDAEEGELTEGRHRDAFEPLFVLPLYSILPTEEQTRIFKPPPDGARLCVVATNVAETSITIPGLKYVVDSGKVKTRVYDKMSGGISNFVITWTSKASANQRAGRAGRTEGGHCYRLYSSSVFEHEFPSFTPPDIQRTPVDDVLLQMKALGIDKVVNFPFPSPPELEALKAAEKRLVILGALQDLQKGQRFKDIEKWEYSAKITALGNAMSRFPVSPHYSKMLLLSYKHEVIPLIIALVSALTVPEVFQTFIVPAEDSEQNTDEAEGKRLWIGVKKIGTGKGKSFHLGDAMVLLRAIAGYEETKNKANFCSKFHIRQKAMVEIHKMRLQLTKEMNRSFKDLDLPLHLKMKPPTDEEVEKLRKILTASLAHHVARKVPDSELGIAKQKLRNAYKCLDTEEYVFIHPSSILHQEAPAFVIYQEIFQTSKLFMRNVIEIEPEWLPGFAPNLCEFSLPLETPPPHYVKETDKILCSMTSTFGRWRWELPCVTLEMPQGLTKYNWFCFFLLDGQVCQFFQQYKSFLISPATNMLKSWAKLLPRTRYILQAAISKEVDSKEALFKTWKTDTKYLLREYCEWLPAEMHMEVTCKWPPQV